MLLLTTTAPELDEELRNRCLVLTVDEDRAQTRAIHRANARRSPASWPNATGLGCASSTRMRSACSGRS